ncbi:CPBP family intramembrane glutamic endopeptidase [Nocardiopsis ansamitocini]|uniref:CPBP family intramembrane glutamic endopeptidase n=1 Tax=Nocardiopsis ansamitocini TaxID=1670832 RepID=UPI0025530222|nr:CPBP family intramembrane glutamic endopeptidase [Nocardiopsis ansamitocini]
MSEFVALMLGMVFFLIGLLVAVALIHRRHPRTLVTAREKISWRRIVHGFVAMFVPWSLILVLGQYLLYPESFAFTPDLATFAIFVPLALVLIGIQTTTEELFCRGYLVQATSLIWANRVFLALVPATIFALLHLGNPEAEAGGWLTMVFFYFLGPGLVWTVVSLVEGTTELAIGAHFAFNVVYFVVVNPAGAAITTPALFTVSEYHATFYALSAVAVIPLFLAISYLVFKREPRRTGSLNSGNGLIHPIGS